MYSSLTFDSVTSISMYWYVQTCTDISKYDHWQVRTLFIIGHGHTRYVLCTYEYERVHLGCQVSRCRPGLSPGRAKPQRQRATVTLTVTVQVAGARSNLKAIELECSRLQYILVYYRRAKKSFEETNVLSRYGIHVSWLGTPARIPWACRTVICSISIFFLRDGPTWIRL